MNELKRNGKEIRSELEKTKERECKEERNDKLQMMCEEVKRLREKRSGGWGKAQCTREGFKKSFRN